MTLSSQLGIWDWVVFAGVLALTGGVVLWGNLRKRRLDLSGEEAGMLDLLLMGRRLTLPLFTCTLVATWYGGILPVTKYAYNVGLYSWLTQGVFWYLAYLLFAVFLVKRIRDTEATTMPDLLEKRFGPKAGKFGAVMNLINVMPILYLVSLGFFLQSLFGGHLGAWVMVGTGVVLAYSVVGGFRSVVFSDLVQFGVMCAAVALVVVASMWTYGGIGWLRASENIPPGHWKPFGEDVAFGATLVWGLVAAGTLVDPNFYHRCLAAKDARTARRGIFLATLVWVAFDFCTTFGALYARAVMPDADSSSVYLEFGVHVLPLGLKGFFLAGFLATILSTLDSYLFLSGTLVSYDLAPRRWKGRVGAHHLGTVCSALAAAGLSMFVHDMELVDVWKIIGGFTTACLVFPLLLGLLIPGKMPERVFLSSCMGGVVCMAAFYGARPWLPEAWRDFEGFYIGVLGTVLGMGGAWLSARTRFRWTWAVGVMLVAAAIFGMREFPWRREVKPWLAALESAGWMGQAGYVLAGGVLVLLFVPASVPVVLAGVLFGFANGLALAMGVLGVGSLGGFVLGRVLWKRIRGLPWFQGARLTAARRAVELEGAWWVAFLRLVPFLHFMSSNLFFGSLPLRLLPYLAYSVIGMLPGTALLVYGGSIANRGLEGGGMPSTWRLAFLAAGAGVFGLVSWRLARRARLELARREAEDQTSM